MRSKVGKDAVLKKPPAYSFGARNEAHMLDDPLPGPGEYPTPISPSNSKFRRSPAAGFGFGRSTSLKQTTPGPGHYSPQHIGPAHPAPAIHGTVLTQPRNHVPGPGAYSADRADKLLKPSAPEFTIATKLEQPGCKEVQPGPGSYQPSLPGSMDQKGVSLKFKHQQNSKDAVLFGTPGPGAYGSGGRLRRGAGFTMGQQLQDKGLVNGLPGPGSYDFE